MKEGMEKTPCDWKCVHATTHPSECICRCGGQNHGYANNRATLDGERYIHIYDEDLIKLFDHVGCLSCGSRAGWLMGYEHENGIEIPSFKMRLWIFWRCQQCGYDTSLQKALRHL